MPFWARLLGRLRGKSGAPGADPATDAESPGPEPVTTPTPHARGEEPEEELETLVAAAEQGSAGLEPDQLQEQALILAESLVARGGEARVIAALGRLQATRPDLHRVGLRLARLFLDMGLEERGIPLLERLLGSGLEVGRVEAHLALARHHARTEGGEAGEAAALAHYEAVLAHDFGHPEARARADDLRRRVDANRPVRPAPTLLGVQDLGEGARYEITRELGRGGGGTVYLATDRRIGRQVALKVLHARGHEAAAGMEHLFCEARIAATLRHPNVITIYDLDEALNMVVMEYCPGGTLASVLPLRVKPALEALGRVASILDLVHRCGVVHRDLKPSNLLLRRQGDLSSLVLTDFGVAHMGQDLAGEGAAAGGGGSLIYMAPEQRRGEEVGPSADLYPCGVILMEMLLGSAPLDAAQALSGVNLLDLEQPWQDAAAQERPHLREAVLSLARELVAPEPARRPGSAAALAEHVRVILSMASA